MVKVRHTYISALLVASLFLGACNERNITTKVEGYRLELMGGNRESDMATDSIISIYREEMQQLMNRTIGESTEMMEAYRPESSLTNTMADAIFQESKEICKSMKLPEPAICVLNTGGIRATLPMGQLTVRNVFEISPFENSVAIVEATGTVLTAMLEHVATRHGEPISGATLSISNGKLLEAKVGGEPIDNDKTYYIITNNYIAEGGDGFEIMRHCKRTDTGIMIRDLFIKYIEGLTAKGQKLSAPQNVRIKVISENE